MRWLLLAWLGTAVTSTLASSSHFTSDPRLFVAFLLAQLPLVALGLFALHRTGGLVRLLPRRGDITLGVVAALVLLLATWGGRALLAPTASPRQAWLLRIYLQLGDPLVLERLWWVHLSLILSACSVELIWRGWVQHGLCQRLGPLRGLIATALGYASATLPTAFLLAEPKLGPNPLVVLVALAVGLLLGQVTRLTERATPAMLAHAIFAHLTLIQFRPGL